MSDDEGPQGQADARGGQEAGSPRREECVKVVVRCRPFNSGELENQAKCCVRIEPTTGQVFVYKPGEWHPDPPAKTYTFDHVYDMHSRQQQLFEETARSIVDSVIQGYNGTIFAYGQTGTGKTFTMEGDPDNPDLRGIMPNSFYYIFDAVEHAATNVQFLVRVSFLEIYNDDVYDLLNKTTRAKMQVKQSKDKGIFVKDLSTFVVKSVGDLLKVLKKGQKARRTGATKMNEGSSRSHSILTVTIENSETYPNGETHYRVGKLNMVDLAGSERQKKTEASGDRLEEAKSINLSLSALGNVIKALVNPNSKHIPFRDSKLTRLLQDSLGGNTKTVMIANVGPSEYNFEETINTLRYADRAKEIKNKPTINEDPKDAMLRQYQEEIEALRKALAEKRGIVSYDASGQPVYGDAVEERVVEQVVYKEGLSEAEYKARLEAAQREQELVNAQSEEERRRILDEKMRAEQEAEMIAAEERRVREEMERERKAAVDLESKLNVMQQQIIAGHADVQEAMRHQQELTQTEAQLNEHEEHERKLKQELDETEEAELFLKHQYRSRQDELQQKTQILKKLWSKFCTKRDELKELEDEFEGEREELIQTIRELDRELKLKELILDSFVPMHYVELIESKAHWDAYKDKWIIPGLGYSGNNIPRADGRNHNDEQKSRPAIPNSPVALRDSSASPRPASTNQPPPKDVYFTYGLEPKKLKKKGSKKRLA